IGNSGGSGFAPRMLQSDLASDRALPGSVLSGSRLGSLGLKPFASEHENSDEEGEIYGRVLPFNFSGQTEGAQQFSFSMSLSQALKYAAEQNARKASEPGAYGFSTEGSA